MKKVMKNKLFKNYLMLFIVLFLVEIIFRAVSDVAVFDISLLRIFIGVNIISLLLAVILSFFKNSIGNAITIIITFIASFYAVIQAGFLNFLGVYISLGTSSQLGAVKDYISDYLGSFKKIYVLIFIPFILLTLYYFLIDKKLFKNFNKEEFKEKANAKKRTIQRAIVIVVLGFLTVFYSFSLTAEFMQNKLQLRTTEDLFKNPSIPNIAVNQFGIIGYGILDVKSQIFPSVGAEGSDEIFEKGKETAVTDYTRVIDDYSWELLIENETNAQYNQLNNYYITRDITDKNEYTGIFEGKNLIVVMMESVNNLIMNEEYFPTISKLAKEGWYWENAYSPRNACSTGNNEMSGVLSLYTINNSCTANRYQNNTYFESLYNLFNNEGYYSSTYHNYNDTYYYRNNYLYNWGSQKYYDYDDLKISISTTYSEWPSDIELMEKALPNFVDEESFFSFILTVSPHHPYGSSSTVGNTYMNLFNDIPNITTSLKRYMSKLKYTDLALEALLNGLEEAGKLEDTVIVLYADHYPYGFKTSELQKLFDYDLEEGKEIDRTPFIIYNSELTPQVFSDYTTYMNIAPTLANLFNLDYDPRLYAGEDILSDDYSGLAIFADGSWQSSIGYYEATTGQMTYMGYDVYNDDEIVEINKTISNKIKMSNLAIQKNYFNYLYEGLKKYPKPDEGETD